MTNTTKNLFFLLSAAPMGLAGCGTLDPFDTSLTTLTTETGGSGDGDGDGDGGTNSMSGDGDGDSGDGDGDSGDGDGDTGDGDGDTGDGDGDGDGDTGDGDGDGDGNPVCADYGALNLECYGMEYAAYAQMYCETALGYAAMYGPDCSSATEALYACLSSLSCEDFMMDPPNGCQDQIATAMMACTP